MAVFVEGTRGAGKSKLAIAEIQSALRRGVPVATNLNLRLDKLVPDKPDCRVIRLPDFPRSVDFLGLGQAYESLNPDDPDTYDESKFGLIVLDETLTYLNSRTWNDKDRALAVSWLVQSRKFGWRLWLLGQDIDSVDKQARETLVDFLYSCRRGDKIFGPIAGLFIKAIAWPLTLGKGLPLFHSCTVYTGKTKNKKMKIQWFLFSRRDLQPCYNTAQQFSADVAVDAKGNTVDMRASFSVLPPRYLSAWYPSASSSPTPRISEAPRRWPLVVAGAACFAFALYLAVLQLWPSDDAPSESAAVSASSAPTGETVASSPPLESLALPADVISDVVITAAVLTIDDFGQHWDYRFSSGDVVWRPEYRRIKVQPVDHCRAVLVYPDDRQRWVVCDERPNLAYTNNPRPSFAVSSEQVLPAEL